MKETVVMLQVSHQLTAPSNPCLRYYEKVYPNAYGYAIASEHFMEIPLWIAVANGLIQDGYYNKVLHVVTSVEETVEFLNTLPWNSIILASVMDVNVNVLQDIHWMAEPKKWVIGGYVNHHLYEWNSTTIWLDDIYSLCHAMHGTVGSAPPDYSIFGEARTIPRLTLSDGCLHNCKFCTIERWITERSVEDVMNQVESFKGMNFDLVYVNDKTFGQASNVELLEQVAERIWTFNPDFVGFIIQTTVQEALRNAKHWIQDLNVLYIEVGVEHVDDEYLARMRKPYNLKMLAKLTSLLRSYKGTVGFIPNLMFALPDADYTSTVEWVYDNRDIITFVNPFILCQYDSSKGKLVDSSEGEHDQDENSLIKSWLSPLQQAEVAVTMQAIFDLTSGGV